MNPKYIISVSEARRTIFNISRNVQAPSTRYLLTEKGKPRMVILSADEYDALVETREALLDIPDLQKLFVDVRRDIKTGNYKKYTNYGGNARSKKAVPTAHKTKRAKRAS